MITIANIGKDALNFLRVETPYIASQKGYFGNYQFSIVNCIFRGVIHADADISATNDEKTRNKKVSRKVRQAAKYSEEKQKPVKNAKAKKARK